MTDLTCSNDECYSRYQALETDSKTETAARAHGWRVWRSGGLDLVLCPLCVGWRVRRDPVPERLDGEQPLF
jgi:hypothetical protein